MPERTITTFPGRMLLLCALCAALAAALAPAARTHSDPCHAAHTCPSDHHTYRWKGLLCTSYKAERTAKDTVKVRFRGRTYYCRR